MVSSLDDVWPMVQCFGKKWIGHSQDDLGTRETRIQHLHIHTHIHTYMYMYTYINMSHNGHSNGSRCLCSGGVILELCVMDGEERSVVCSIGEWVDQTGEEEGKGIWGGRDWGQDINESRCPTPPLAPTPSPSHHWPLPT